MATDYLTDTHAHLDLLGDNETVGKFLSTARGRGVKRVISVGDSLESSRHAAGLTEQFSGVFGAVGVHPHHADDVDDNMIQQIWAVANQPKIVAIGETGLDFFRMKSAKEEQINAFKAHIELAKRLDLALIVHCRDAYPETIDILKKAALARDRFVIHCFSGSAADAAAMIELGAYISFAGNITFTNADPLRLVVKEVPLDRLLVETDCPYLTPHPHRGDQNEPALLPLVAETIAAVKGAEFDAVVKATTANADNLFGF